jgi:hypothetical protein
MIAARDLKHPTRIRIRALLDILDPRTIDAERNMIFSLARDRASMAANTFAVIDDKPVFHQSLSSVREGHEFHSCRK